MLVMTSERVCLSIWSVKDAMLFLLGISRDGAYAIGSVFAVVTIPAVPFTFSACAYRSSSFDS